MKEKGPFWYGSLYAIIKINKNKRLVSPFLMTSKSKTPIVHFFRKYQEVSQNLQIRRIKNACI